MSSPEICGEICDNKIYRVVLSDVAEFLSSLHQVDHLVINYTNSSFQMGHFFIIARAWLPKLPKAVVKVSVICLAFPSWGPMQHQYAMVRDRGCPNQGGR